MTKPVIFAMPENPRPAKDAVGWIKIATAEQMKFATECLERMSVPHQKWARCPLGNATEIEGAVWVTNEEDIQMIIATVHAMADANLFPEED